MMSSTLHKSLFLAMSLALVGSTGCAVDVQDDPIVSSGPTHTGDTTDPSQAGSLPTIEPIAGRIPLRDTADRGNSLGLHGCATDMGAYSHYEEVDRLVGETGSQLHVVSINASEQGARESQGVGEGNVVVHVSRPGASTLVLSSYAPTHWQVTAGPGAQIERIILSGFSRQTASAPAGTLVEEYAYETNRVVLGRGVEWPSYDSTNLVLTAEQITGLPLASFRGCFASSSFQIDEPRHVAPPRDEHEGEEPVAMAGCEDVTAESTYCMTISDGHLAMVGLDSGVTCRGPEAGAVSYDSPSLAWVGEYVYSCLYDRGIARTSLADGTVDVAPIACGTVTSHQNALTATAMIDPASAGAPLGKLLRFRNFELAACREPEFSFGEIPEAQLIATQGDRLYMASQAGKVTVANLYAEDKASTVTELSLEGYNGWITAMDATADGKLVVAGPTSGGLHIFDAETGALERIISLDSGSSSAWGLECVTRPVI